MKLALTAALLLLAGLVSAVAAASAEDQAVYDWYDTLGNPRLNELPWAEISVQFQFEGQPPDKHQLRAFIGKSGKDGTWVVAPDFRTYLMEADAPASRITSGTFHWEARDLAADMRNMLAGPLPQPGDKIRPFFTTGLAQRAQLVVYARTLQALGEEAVAAEVLRAARKLPVPEGADKEAPFQKALENDFGAQGMQDLLKMLGGLDDEAGNANGRAILAPRTMLLEKADRLIRLLPQTPQAARAADMAATLRRMIAEDKEHSSPSDAELARLPTQQRVAELTFRLRDLNARSWSDHGVNLFSEHAKTVETAAHQLASLGLEAVPQLIEALKDTRFSRSIDIDRHGPDLLTPRQALTIGDCAERILSHIAKRDFFRPGNEQATMTEAGKAEETRQAVVCWLDQAQKNKTGSP
ncbi:MAG TPA: hypothetical protein VGE39_22095 [Prosthecobacter sp.]